jgi:SPP1 family predicted phage head-tail adaptor
MATVTIGKFNKRVTFRNPTKVADVAGGHSESYTDLLETWAAVEDRGGDRIFENGVDAIINRKTIYAFYRSALAAGLTKDTRIVYDGKEYAIDRITKVDEIKKIIQIEAVTDDD